MRGEWRAMDLPGLLQHYGYALIFVGTLAEGESLLVLGGYFAHRGYLDLGGVIATSFVAAVCGDQLFFYVGRHHAKRLLERFPPLREKVQIALLRAERHQNLVVLGMRFLWGLRIALPLAMGLSSMNGRKFFWLNLLSAAVWSSVFALVGFGASHLFTQFVDDLHLYEKWVALGLLLTGAAVLSWRWHGAQRLSRID
jgi:membrane protein DedA with SNARE-associated domain